MPISIFNDYFNDYCLSMKKIISDKSKQYLKIYKIKNIVSHENISVKICYKVA